jgi:GT2 family glycosyltransferase
LRGATVVIPNWNGRELLPICLDSLRRQSMPAEVIVVDDGSADGSAGLVRERYPEVRLIELGENRGFAAAVNAGIQASRTGYVALLNNDAEAAPGWLEGLVAAFDACPDAGFAASKMLDYADRTRIDGAGDAFTWEGNAYRVGHGERDCGQYDAPAWVFGACAGAAIYRRQMLDVIGLFDEAFFAYYEDADLSFRAQLAGYRCRYVPEAVVYHVGSATTGRASDRTLYLQTRNRIALVLKNYPARFLVEKLPQVLRFQLEVLRRAQASGRLPTVARALQAAAADAPRALRARRETQRLRTTSDRALAAIVDAPPCWWHTPARRALAAVGRR